MSRGNAIKCLQNDIITPQHYILCATAAHISLVGTRKHTFACPSLPLRVDMDTVSIRGGINISGSVKITVQKRDLCQNLLF